MRLLLSAARPASLIVALMLCAFTVMKGQDSTARRPSVVVMSFESGTVMAKVHDKHGFSAFLSAMRGEPNNEHYDPAELGAGISDMLVEKLLNAGGFKLLERKDSGTVAGARYMITGSVTKFGFEEHQLGGFAASVATFGMLSVKKHKTEVTLTARIVDVATGEIVAAFDGEGVSNKGGGVSILGMGSNGGGGGSASNSNFKETAIGEATERAVQNLSEKIQAKRALLADR